MGTGLEIPIIFAAASAAGTAVAQNAKKQAAQEQLKQVTAEHVDKKGQLASSYATEAGINKAVRFARGGGGGSASEDAVRIAGEYGADLFALNTNYENRKRAIMQEGKGNPLEVVLSGVGGFMSGMSISGVPKMPTKAPIPKAPIKTGIPKIPFPMRFGG